MATITPDYQIAAGNNNVGGLTLITSLADTNGAPFVMPRGKASRTRGERRFKLNHVISRVGKNGYTLLSGIMTIDQYQTLISTYEGLVTVRISLSSTTFSNFNAACWFDDENTLEYIPHVNSVTRRAGFTGPCYQNVSWHLTSLEAL